jgi:hypothetical protein
MRALFFWALAITLGGCGVSETVYLRHPETGTRIQCGPYFGIPRSNHIYLRDCVGDYQQQGYVRVPAP